MRDLERDKGVSPADRWKEEPSRRRNKNRGPKVGAWKQEASWLDLRRGSGQ